jgi:hypothetical protein
LSTFFHFFLTFFPFFPTAPSHRAPLRRILPPAARPSRPSTAPAAPQRRPPFAPVLFAPAPPRLQGRPLPCHPPSAAPHEGLSRHLPQCRPRHCCPLPCRRPAAPSIARPSSAGGILPGVLASSFSRSISVGLLKLQ